jgi:hypothetical protein
MGFKFRGSDMFIEVTRTTNGLGAADRQSLDSKLKKELDVLDLPAMLQETFKYDFKSPIYVGSLTRITLLQWIGVHARFASNERLLEV